MDAQNEKDYEHFSPANSEQNQPLSHAKSEQNQPPTTNSDDKANAIIPEQNTKDSLSIEQDQTMIDTPSSEITNNTSNESDQKNNMVASMGNQVTFVNFENSTIEQSNPIGNRTLENYLNIKPSIQELPMFGSVFAQDSSMAISQIGGRYKILEKIGEGGMGEVCKAYDQSLKRYVAIKFLKSCQTEQRERLKSEARAIAQLNHPNIVTIYDIDQDLTKLQIPNNIVLSLPPKTLYLVMEYVHGKSLAALLNDNSEPLDIYFTIKIALQVATGLLAAHECGIIHRDIKPGNILLTKEGKAKIVDFGIAKTRREKENKKSNKDVEESEGAIYGTPDYMSPEQIDNQEIDQRADIYSFGITLYYMLSYNLPFPPGNYIAHLSKQPEPILQYSPKLPHFLAKIIHKMIATDPNKRYKNLQEVIEVLIEFSQERQITLPIPFPVFLIEKDKQAPLPKQPSRNIWLVMIILWLLIALFADQIPTSWPSVVYHSQPVEDIAKWQDENLSVWQNWRKSWPEEFFGPKIYPQNIENRYGRFSNTRPISATPVKIERPPKSENNSATQNTSSEKYTDKTTTPAKEILIPPTGIPKEIWLEVWKTYQSCHPHLQRLGQSNDWKLKEKNEFGYLEYLHRPSSLVMVAIPPGEFQMGSNFNDSEMPVYIAVLTSPFLISKYEVTREAWKKFIKENSTSSSESLSTPIYYITWKQSVNFCQYFGLDLPTEAEWEYSCRANTTTNFYWGDNFNKEYLWCWDSLATTIYPVGQKKPNNFGLYDMSGNVEEWCLDIYDSYSTSTKNDPIVTKSKISNNHIARGGNAFDFSLRCRSASRASYMESNIGLIGFRPVFRLTK